jgi:hypothetical protein
MLTVGDAGGPVREDYEMNGHTISIHMLKWAL